MATEANSEDAQVDNLEASQDQEASLDVATEDVKVNVINKDECSTSNVVGDEEFSEDEEEDDGIPVLEEHEIKALEELRSLLEESILNNKFLKEDGENAEIDKDIKLWGISLLPSKNDEGIDTVLLKFLTAKEFKPDEAFEMLRNTIHWRKENKMDSILEEDFGTDYESVTYLSGVDHEGHPVCYNVYGVFGDDEIYNKTFGTEESLQRFLRWRLQILEKQILELDFSPGGVSSFLQVNDLKDTPGPARKDLRLAMNKAVALLQDNYPEFVARNIFINVPFWYYAFNALLAPFLSQRTKDKFVFTRSARVTETLLKYIPGECIPVQYGGLMLEYDPEFTIEDEASEMHVKPGGNEIIEIPVPDGGCVVIWDLIVQGWDVNYKEEFVPRNESSYIIIVTKERKLGGEEESVRNSFRTDEPGKVVITIENVAFKKKRILYRFKIKSTGAYYF